MSSEIRHCGKLQRASGPRCSVASRSRDKTRDVRKVFVLFKDPAVGFSDGVAVSLGKIPPGRHDVLVGTAALKVDVTAGEVATLRVPH